MVKLRIMLPEGERAFKEYIHELRNNPFKEIPDLSVEPFSREFSPQILIDNKIKFNKKIDLAKHLHEYFTLASIRRENVLSNNGLWTWLAYILIDQLAPIDPDTREREIKEDAKYICSSDYRDYYRHLVLGPYSIYSIHGEEDSLIFLYNPVNEHNDFVEQFASRQFIISHNNIVKAIKILYLDFQTGRPKSGAQSRNRPGNIRRFLKIIQQFELTFDIYSMEPERILDLLPEEFNAWK